MDFELLGLWLVGAAIVGMGFFFASESLRNLPFVKKAAKKSKKSAPKEGEWVGRSGGMQALGRVARERRRRWGFCRAGPLPCLLGFCCHVNGLGPAFVHATARRATPLPAPAAAPVDKDEWLKGTYYDQQKKKAAAQAAKKAE